MKILKVVLVGKANFAVEQFRVTVKQQNLNSEDARLLHVV
jgi:hypothetical protein